MITHSDGMAAAQDSPARKQAAILVVIVLAVIWGLITHGTFAGSGDEPHYLIIARSLAFDGDLDLANDYRDATLIGGGTLRPESHAIVREGRLRPVHDVGMPLVFAPVVRVAYPLAEWLAATLPAAVLDAARLNAPLLLRHQISLLMALLTALLARQLFLLLRALGSTGNGALLWALLFAVTPPVLSHSFLFFTEIPTALAALFIFRRLALQQIHTIGAAAGLGFLTGCLFLVHARNAGLVAGLALAAFLGFRDGSLSRRLLLAFCAAGGLAILGRTMLTFVMWGSFVTTPHAAPGAAASSAAFVREVSVRATGLLFDREYGLLAYGPIYLLAAPGFLALRARHGQLARDALVVLACYLVPVLLPVTNVHGWTGGWSPAARFLVPVAPLLWIAVHTFATHAAGAGRAAAGALVAAQIAINAFVWQFPKTLWNDGDGVSAFGAARWLPGWTDPGAAISFALALLMTVFFTWFAGRSATRARSPVREADVAAR